MVAELPNLEMRNALLELNLFMRVILSLTGIYPTSALSPCTHMLPVSKTPPQLLRIPNQEQDGLALEPPPAIPYAQGGGEVGEERGRAKEQRLLPPLRPLPKQLQRQTQGTFPEKTDMPLISPRSLAKSNVRHGGP